MGEGDLTPEITLGWVCSSSLATVEITVLTGVACQDLHGEHLTAQASRVAPIWMFGSVRCSFCCLLHMFAVDLCIRANRTGGHDAESQETVSDGSHNLNVAVLI